MKNKSNMEDNSTISELDYLTEVLDPSVDYLFKDLCVMLIEKFNNANNINSIIKLMELKGDIVKLKTNDKPIFKSTKNLPMATGTVKWQQKDFSLVYLDDEGIPNGKTLKINKKESSRVLNGERIQLKVLPEEWHKSLENMGIVIDVLNTAPCYTIGENVGTIRTGWLGAVRLYESMFTQVIRLSEKHENRHNEDFNNTVKETGTLLSGFLRRTGKFERANSLRAWFDVKYVIGKWSTPGIETKLAIEWMRAEEKFNNNIMAEAYNIVNISVKDLLSDRGRKDLRSLPFVTIDSPSSRDLDDAVSAQLNYDGSCRVFVAISDVSRYVTPGSVLDNVAKRRGSTLYFPHRSIPMLPDILSTGLCSLNPGIERAAMVCEANVTKEGEVKNVKFYSALIISKARLLYSEIDYFIAEQQEELPNIGKLSLDKINETGYSFAENEQIKNVVSLLVSSAEALRSNRKPRNNYRTPEIFPIIGENGKAQSLKISNEMTPAHKLVEEFMCLVNKESAKIISKRGGINALFRNQLAPDEELVLKSAEYNIESQGHYAFGNEDYMHFSSPIRRYPDLLAHRAMKKVLGFMYDNEPTVEELKELGRDCTEMQRLSKGAAEKARRWLILEYANRKKDVVEPVEILEELDNGWLVYGKDTKIPGYISKLTEGNEIMQIKEPGMLIQVDRVDYFNEKVFFKLLSPVPELNVDSSTVSINKFKV